MKLNTDDELKRIKARNKLKRAYKTVFINTGEDGKIVLRDILNELQFFSFTNVSTDSNILNRAGKKIMSNAGIWTPKTVKSIVSSLLAIDQDIEKEK